METTTFGELSNGDKFIDPNGSQVSPGFDTEIGPPGGYLIYIKIDSTSAKSLSSAASWISARPNKKKGLATVVKVEF